MPFQSDTKYQKWNDLPLAIWTPHPSRHPCTSFSPTRGGFLGIMASALVYFVRLHWDRALFNSSDFYIGVGP